MQAGRRRVERTCIACRAKGAPERFVRYVAAPDGRVLVDYRGRLPGRGAYTCLTRECIENAVRRKSFGRAFRGDVVASGVDELIDGLVQAIGQRIGGLVAMARKSGSLIDGTGALPAAFEKNEIRFLVVASDAADAVAARLTRMADERNVGWKRWFSRVELGRMTGRENRNCVGFRDQNIASLLELEMNRLQQIAGEN